MMKPFIRQRWLLFACASIAFTSAHAATAQTDLASMVVTPLTRQPNATADWQTIYDYAGGDVLPPGTRLTANGKWIDPVVRKDKSGVTFAFPDLPDSPTAAQFLNIAFAVERPIANYPTRTTIHYTSYKDQASHVRSSWWFPFWLTTADYNFTVLSSQLEGLDGDNVGDLPIHLTGENTLVLGFDGKGNTTVLMNDKDASGFLGRNRTPVADNLPQPGAMLLPGLAIRNKVTQTSADKGDWFAIHSFKIEQMRPPLDSSAVAAVDLTVPGNEPIRVTIEIVDDKNDSKGYLLRDMEVSPGKYRLYWDGIDQKQSQPINTSWIGAGAYSFHLTTSKVQVQFAGDMNNSAPKFNMESYGMVNCTALAMTPPGTTVQAQWNPENFYADLRKFDGTDSVQLLCTGYDSKQGQWVGADGTVIHTKTGDAEMQRGRGLAVTPPDPKNPTLTDNQFYFASTSIRGGYAIVTCSLPDARGSKPTEKTFTSPEWNRPPPASWPYTIKIGQIPYMPGPQHFLIFQMSTGGKNQAIDAEWTYKNVRLYEEGDPNPKPVIFDASLFTPRLRAVPGKNPPVIPPGSLTVEDGGKSVHMKNAISVNYPFEYTITPHTILAFDLDLKNKTVGLNGNGIGIDTQPLDVYPALEGRYFNFLAGRDQGRFGFYNPSLGAFDFPNYQPNTLYTDSVPTVPPGTPLDSESTFLWQPGFYGVKISEDGKYLFACNNADNRLEVHDISTDGGTVAKIPIDYPMFVTMAPEGTEGAAQGTRFIYVDSPKAGLVRIAWNLANNTFSKSEMLTPATEFAYPRGLVYNAAVGRLFVCDTYTLDRSKTANQIAVIDPKSGKVLSRFGKQGGVDPKIGGPIDEQTFTCPLTIDADSKGALWVNDYFSCEVRKYDFDPATNGFKLERRVLGPNNTNTSHFYWMPGDPPTRAWTVGGFFVRNEADIDPDGRFTNQRATSATYNPLEEVLRPYAHFTGVGKDIYATFAGQDRTFQRVGDGWESHFGFGDNAGIVAREAGLLARPGEPPTALDKAIAAANDPAWERESWIWSDLNGDGKIDYSDNNPELKIAFNSAYSLGRYVHYPCANFRSSDGAYVRVDIKSGGLLVIPPKTVNGKASYDWSNAQLVPLVAGKPVMDVLAQDNQFYALRTSSQHHDVGPEMISDLECYDETGKLLWTREHDDFTLVSLQTLGDGMFTVMDRGGWNTEGPVMVRNSTGDLVCQVFCRQPGDCWSNGALRIDADTAYVGIVQAYKITGLTTIKSTSITANLPAAQPLQ